MRERITYAVGESTTEIQYWVVRDGATCYREYPDGSTGECSEGDRIAACMDDPEQDDNPGYQDDPELDQYI